MTLGPEVLVWPDLLFISLLPLQVLGLELLPSLPLDLPG